MADPTPQDFVQSMLKEYYFPGTDAAVVFIANGTEPAADVQEALARSRFKRWYPVDGGHRVKMPWHFAEGSESLFERESKGWDHEHCDFCDAHINIGETCWTIDTPGGGFLAFCRDCATKVPPG